VVIFLGKTHSFVVFWLVQNVFVPESFPGSIPDLETEKSAAPECSGLPAEKTCYKPFFIDELF